MVIGRALSTTNERCAEYGRVLYRQGFLDAVRLLKSNRFLKGDMVKYKKDKIVYPKYSERIVWYEKMDGSFEWYSSVDTTFCRYRSCKIFF